MTTRPGRPIEERTGRFWREVCSCGWIGRQWSSHAAAKREPGRHRRERYGWYGDREASTPPREVTS